MALDSFMKVDGIPGESTDAAHKGWFELLTLGTGSSQLRSPSSGKGAVSRRPAATIEDFQVTMVPESGTPVLVMALLNGRVISRIDIEVCLASQDKHVVYAFELGKVTISRYQLHFPQDDESKTPTLEVGLNFATIKFMFTPIDQSGLTGATTERRWNVAKNKEE